MRNKEDRRGKMEEGREGGNKEVDDGGKGWSSKEESKGKRRH